MRLVILPIALVMVLVLTACGNTAPPPARQQTPAPQAGAPAAEGEQTPGEAGPTRLVGSINYTNFSIPIIMQSPSPTLIDMAPVVRGDKTSFAPAEGQILGQMTSPVSPPPLSYAFNLPAVPTASWLDVDNDGEEDQGVQIFQLVVASNINGGSYLEQLDQRADLSSYLSDPVTDNITEGSLLIYAADDQQRFPSGFGEDGVLFTADDPTEPVQPGYTVVRFGPDGFSYDRSGEAELNVLEAAEAASPDFSAQGIAESFNSLIDHLAVHYSFTDLRQLDWEAIRAQYLPLVQEAEQLAASNADAATAVYTTILHRMAQSLRDAHVETAITDPARAQAAALANQLMNQPIAANIGANTVELDDGRIIITSVAADSPAEKAGLVFGTEVVAVNGKPVAELLPTVVYNESTGTADGQRLLQVANVLKFPGPDANGVIADATVEVKLPGADATQTLTMTPETIALPNLLASPARAMPINYEIQAPVAYLTWNGFLDPGINMAVLEQFLSQVKQTAGLNGVVLDLRGNGGGWDNLYFTMASYFFNAEKPVSMHWIDMDVFDPEANGLVREAPDERLISAPKPELYYDGPLVILVDNNCASSCEFFSQFMQKNGRASVVAQYASKGAGAPVNRVTMPGGIVFQYTKGRSYFAGTEELNLEAKGVTPDVKVPVTEETEQAKLQGSDPVLAAAIEALANLTVQAATNAITMVPLPDSDAGYTAVAPEGWTFTEQLQAYVSADGKQALGYYTPDTTDVDALLASLEIPDAQAALVDTRSANVLDWSIYGSEVQSFSQRLAVAQVDGKLYVIRLLAPPEEVDALQSAVLEPAIAAFAVGQ